MIRDVTERKVAESEREKRHHARRPIDQVLLLPRCARIAHAPNPSSGLPASSCKDWPGPLNPEQRKQLGDGRRSARHLLALVNGVLDISKIEAEHSKSACEPLTEAVHCQGHYSVTRWLEKKGLALRVALASELGETVSDERRFEQSYSPAQQCHQVTDHGELRCWRI